MFFDNRHEKNAFTVINIWLHLSIFKILLLFKDSHILILHNRTWETMTYPSHGGTEGIASNSMPRVITDERLLRKGLTVFLRWNEEDSDYKL